MMPWGVKRPSLLHLQQSSRLHFSLVLNMGWLPKLSMKGFSQGLPGVMYIVLQCRSRSLLLKCVGDELRAIIATQVVGRTAQQN